MNSINCFKNFCAIFFSWHLCPDAVKKLAGHYFRSAKKPYPSPRTARRKTKPAGTICRKGTRHHLYVLVVPLFQ